MTRRPLFIRRPLSRRCPWCGSEIPDTGLCPYCKDK